MITYSEHSPQTLEEAIKLVADNLADEEIDFIKEHGAESAHHTAGQAIRNAWLWDNPKEGRVRPLAQHFRDRFGLGHADDMSNLILCGVTASVKQVPYDPTPHVESSKKHWRGYNIDPLTQERLDG